MTKHLTLLLFIGLAWGQENPCEEQRYLDLINIPLDKMSDRDYEYFMKIDSECKSNETKTPNFNTDRPPYIIAISTNPSNAALYINDKYIGLTPKTITLNQPDAFIKITYESQNYEPIVEKIILKEGHNRKKYVLKHNSEYYKDWTWWDYNGKYFFICGMAVLAIVYIASGGPPPT